MRVVKEADERKNEILDVAQELFVLNGFDNTSTNDILARVGIARGTLYYHFKSKEEILDSIIERMTSEAMAKSIRISGDIHIPLLDRFTQSIMALNLDSGIAHEVMDQVHKPQNALMHQKMQERLLSGIVPVITKLINEGNEQGLFKCSFPDVAAEIAMLYSNTAFDALAENTPEQLQRKMIGFIDCVEKMLGCEQGVMTNAIMKIFQA